MDVRARTEPIDLPRGPRRDDEWTVTITRLGDKGEGVAAVDVRIGPDRRERRYTVHIRGALPGESVTGRIVGRHRRSLDARLIAIDEPIATRIEPTCVHFGDTRQPGRGCGGCSLQNLAHPAQLDAKHAMVSKLLADRGLDVQLVKPTTAASPTWHYRNKMELSFGNDRDRQFSLGLHPAGYRYETLALSECRLMSPFASAFVPALASWAQDAGYRAFDPRKRDDNAGFLRTLTLREGKRTGQHMAVIETEASVETPAAFGSSFVAAAHRIAADLDGSFDSVWWIQRDAERGKKTTYTSHHLAGTEMLREQLHLPGGRRLLFDIAPRAFFQPSTLGAEAIYAETLRQTGLADGSTDTVLDLYCGTGTIGMCLSPWAKRVIGIDLSADAIASAHANADLNGIDNVELHCGDTGKVLTDLGLGAGGIDVIVVDPPRAGLQGAALDQVVALAPKRLVYVACRPSSLARDASLLREKGYELKVVQPIDQFPHTGHVECVATLDRTTLPQNPLRIRKEPQKQAVGVNGDGGSRGKDRSGEGSLSPTEIRVSHRP